jgi:hypothetical protein
MKGNIIMSTAAQQKVEVPGIINDPAFINTPFGPVVVFGHHLVSKKDLIILEHCLDFPDASEVHNNNSVKSIIFRGDNKPKDNAGNPVLGNVSFDHNSIAINLLKMVGDAILEAQNKPEVAILASYHRNLILTILHEIYHLSSLEEFPTDPVKEQAEEDAAEEWAKETLFWLAKTTDIEPAHHSESSFLAGQLMELLMEKDDEWSIKQRNMLDNHMFYHLPDKINRREVSIHSFKEYMKFQAPDFEDKVWSNTTINGVIPVPAPTQPLWDKGYPHSDLPPQQPTTPAMVAAAFNTVINPVSMEVEDDGWVEIPEAFGNHGEVVYDDAPIQQPMFGTMQGYAQTQQPQQTKAPVKVYSETGFTEEQTAEIAKAVYFKCYNHLFGACGPRTDSDIPFNFPKLVYQQGIPLTEQEKQVVVKMDCYDVQGRLCDNMPTSGGYLHGKTTSRIDLPVYKIYLNMNGYELCRMLMPQNTAKNNGQGGLSKQALDARAGSHIMYIKEGNDNIIKAGGEVWRHKIINGEFMKG